MIRNHMSQLTGKRTLLSIGFILLHNFTLNPLGLFLDALRLAGDDGDADRLENCSWAIMGPSLNPVRSSCGVEIAPWRTFPDPNEFDYIAVVGGAMRNGPEICDRTIAYLRKAAKLGVPLIGICTGSFALVRAGLMHNRRCCVGWSLYRLMKDEFPEVIPVGDQSFVVDGDRLTCAGGVTAAHLAAWLIEKHCGHALAHKALHILFIDRQLPPQTAQPQPPMLPPATNKHVRRALLVIEQNMSAPLELQDLARRINISNRQLSRVFDDEFGMSPQEFCRMFRLKYGLWLLINSNHSVTDIAAECGFTDVSHFSREFRRYFSCPPSSVRGQQERAYWHRVFTAKHDSEGIDSRSITRRHRVFV
jgi:transcriptional regulator GlxA family with amidase domain